MKVFKAVTLIMLLLLLFNGCHTSRYAVDICTSESFENLDSPNEKLQKDYITVGTKTFHVDEINSQIKNVFNNELYYGGHDTNNEHFIFNTQLALNKVLEYELYFESNENDSAYEPQILLVITNLKHPMSEESVIKRYEFGIDVTEYGLRSFFGYFGHSIYDKTYSFSDRDVVFLGNYSMCIKEITEPIHEEQSTQWKDKAEAALALYMENNNFYSEADKNLLSGEYCVYIRGFSASDENSEIIFEHENGGVYIGHYYFIHEISEGYPADLNHVELVDNSAVNDYLREYLRKVKQNASLVVYCSVP